VNLPSQITGTPVNTGVISNQNFGQRFNLLPTAQKIDLLFD